VATKLVAGTPPLFFTVKVSDELVWVTAVLAKVAGPGGVIVNDAFATHTPLAPSQVRPPAQSAPTAQVKHCVVLLHWVLWQEEVVDIVQSPRVLHTDAVVRDPPAQLAGTHCTSVPGYAHCVRELPSHLPRHASRVPAQAGRLFPRGASMTVTHLPFTASAHASH
jgi:hypothetical protein